MFNKFIIRLLSSHRCVSENECFDKWWIVTADDPKCLSKQNTPTGKAGEPIECNFCCKGAGCNRLMRIPDSQLYTGQDHPSSGIGGIIQIGWWICKWLIKPVMFYPSLRRKFSVIFYCLHVSWLFAVCIPVSWRMNFSCCI